MSTPGNRPPVDTGHLIRSLRLQGPHLADVQRQMRSLGADLINAAANYAMLGHSSRDSLLYAIEQREGIPIDVLRAASRHVLKTTPMSILEATFAIANDGLIPFMSRVEEWAFYPFGEFGDFARLSNIRDTDLAFVRSTEILSQYWPDLFKRHTASVASFIEIVPGIPYEDLMVAGDLLAEHGESSHVLLWEAAKARFPEELDQQ